MTHREAASELPVAIAWVVLFAIVVSHLPAVGFDFAGRDFDGLARAAGVSSAPGWPAYLWSSWILWSLQWPIFQTAPAGYHGTSLVALALLAVMTARVAFRLGAGSAGAALAGLLVALGPCTWLAVGWVSAGAEIWTMLFAVAALELWIDPRGGVRPLLGGLLAGLALLSSPAGLGVVALLVVAQRAFGAAEAAPTRRARNMLLVLLGAGAVGSVLVSVGLLGGVSGSVPPSTLSNDAFVALREIPARMADAFWPWASPLRGAAAQSVGALVLGGAAVASVVRARQGDLRPGFAFAWALLTLLPSIWLNPGTLAHHALGAKIGLVWMIAFAGGPIVERALGARSGSTAARGALLAAAFVVVVIAGGLGVQSVTHARRADGRLSDPILHLTSVTADVRRQTVAMAGASARDPLRGHGPEEVLVLQAARVELPEDLGAPEGAEVILRTPVYTALRGNRGLGLLLGEGIEARWVSHLDEARIDAMVLLDVGDDRLRGLGPVENARIYSALIAVAAGQFPRARHDLWHTIHLQGAQVRFAFDPDSLPIEPAELDAEAPHFAHFLVDKDEPSSMRVLRLFEQIYEEVRGRELIRDLDETLRAPRMRG